MSAEQFGKASVPDNDKFWSDMMKSAHGSLSAGSNKRLFSAFESVREHLTGPDFIRAGKYQSLGFGLRDGIGHGVINMLDRGDTYSFDSILDPQQQGHIPLYENEALKIKIERLKELLEIHCEAKGIKIHSTYKPWGVSEQKLAGTEGAS